MIPIWQKTERGFDNPRMSARHQEGESPSLALTASQRDESFAEQIAEAARLSSR